MGSPSRLAPELITDTWFNTHQTLNLSHLRGRVVLLKAFQMLCPGCVSHALPQARKVYETFPRHKLHVIGLHSVFEHHEAMTSTALAAFIKEYKIQFPVAVDKPGTDSPIPQTMARYQMQGTPTLILIDHRGRLRKQHFGMESDIRLGAEIMSLIGEIGRPEQATTALSETLSNTPQQSYCENGVCSS